LSASGNYVADQHANDDYRPEEAHWPSSLHV
jgi:hypothetical protein